METLIYLQPSLAQHRRGRLLTKVANAQRYDELPDSGVILVIGQEFQGSNKQEQQQLVDWCQKLGRTLLLLPPFGEGRLLNEADWVFSFRESPIAQEPESLAGVLSAEVTLNLQGHNGSFDPTPDYQWQDATPNCRYLKAHSGTGVLAATTLPLWSISLMGKSTLLKAWISHLHDHAGVASPEDDTQDTAFQAQALEPIDYTAMVCIYGWQCTDEASFCEQVGSSTLFSIDPESLGLSLKRLKNAGYLNISEVSIALTEQGLGALQDSPYQIYAEHLYAEHSASAQSGSGTI